MRKLKRLALNRGTAVHLGGAKVRYIWPCGCKRTETFKTPIGPLHESGVAQLVKNWRLNGVGLAQCRRHPDWFSPKSQLERLNAENPQPSIISATKEKKK